MYQQHHDEIPTHSQGFESMTEDARKRQECELVRVLSDGTPVVRCQGVEQPVEIEGIEVSQPPPPLYFEIFEQRLAHLRKPLRCTFQTDALAGRARVRMEYFAWHDKSGDVWRDVGELLVEQGVARATSAAAETGVKP
jgi:hypothetical protein